MPLCQPLEVRRTKVAHLNPITYDNGLGVSAFYEEGTAYFGSQTVPPGNRWSDGTPSFMAPISHFHLLQSETFHVASGKGIWYLGDRIFRLSEGEDVTIPPWISHRFENDPESKDPLVVLYRYDAQRYQMEERFFRNALTYLDDCRKAGAAPSLLQICVMCTAAWMPPDVLPVPKALGEYVKCTANLLLMWMLAAVGWAFFGYRASYVEYYNPGESKKAA